jgi:hypothetical protein
MARLCSQDAPKADAETLTMAEYQVRLPLAQKPAWICLLRSVTPASLGTKCQTAWLVLCMVAAADPY